jgi:GH43 family beta-xylosidase
MKKTKKGIALLTMSAVLAGIVPVGTSGLQEVQAADLPKALVDFDFENLNANQEIVTDSAKATGTYGLSDSHAGGGKALSLNGTNQWLNITTREGKSLLTGLDELTISYDAKMPKNHVNWGFFAARSASETTYQNEHYVGTVHNPAADKDHLVAERFNGGARPASAWANVSAYDNKWVHVDVVHTEKDVTLYVDGQEAGKEASAFKISDILGKNSVLYLGKATWGANGEYGKGLIDNFRIYDTALNKDQITEQYGEYVLEFDKEALSLPEETDRSISLPTTGGSGLTEITWSSNNPEVMGNDGTITRGDEDEEVVITATLKSGESKVTKEFTIVVKAKNPDEDVVAYTKELTLNAGFVSEDLKLPAKVGDAEVAWEVKAGDAIEIKDGKAVVTRGEENAEVTLVATIKVEGATKDGTKEFPLTVVGKGTGVAAYVSSKAPTNIESEGYGFQGGMKLAEEGKEGYEVLHKDQPILYSSIGAKKYAAPTIFRKADGSFGMIASDGGRGTVIVYDSKDLTTYENQRSAVLPVNKIEKMTCVYDSADQVYKVFVQAADDVTLLTTTDFETFENKGVSSYKFKEVENAPTDAVWAEEEALTKAEYTKVAEKFKNPYNTDLKVTAKDVTVDQGTEISAELLSKESEAKVSATYSDGTKKTYGITWDENDIAKIDTSRPGTYTVDGVVGTKYTDAEAPLIPERADPHIIYNEDDGYYYFTSSYPMNGGNDADGYDRLILRRAKTVAGLETAEEVTIWDEKDDPKRGRFIWAPELHKIGDSWYFLSTAGINSGTGTTFNIRPFMVKCNNSDDMMNPDSWEMAGDVKAMAGDEKNCLNAMSLDMTYFEAGGRHYLCWADFTKNEGNPEAISSLYIATIDPSDPTQLTSKASVITVPEYFWENVRHRVNEGPAVIQKGDNVYLAYSASGTGSEYCIGLLSGKAGDDLTNPDNWTKNPYPIMTSTDFNDEVSGPGHNSFTVDENGNQIIVYHARPTEAHKGHSGDPLYDPCRHAYIKPVFYDKDGMPILNMSEKEFAKEGKTSIKVTVKGDMADTTPSLEYKFDEEYNAETGVADTGKDKDKNASLSEGASYVWDKEYGQVLYLDGDKKVNGHNAFLEFPKGFFDGKDRMTISMDVKEVTRSGNYFSFGVGQDNNKYLFLKVEPTKIKSAISTTSYQNEKQAVQSGAYPNNNRVWQNIKIVVTQNSLEVYRNGEKIAANNNTGISMTDLGENLIAYLGKSLYNEKTVPNQPDKYFRAYYDNVKVYDWAMTDEEVKSFTEKDETARKEMMGAVAMVADTVTIPNADSIKGNITLPAEKNGVSIEWTSSNEDVISTKVVKNEGYDDTPAGVVTRQKKDTKVTLTAEFSKKGSESITKKYEVTVKAAPKEVKEEDYVGYLFARFNGTEENINQEQTYFSLSKDGLNWENLNGNKPVLSSNIGESGLRDHYIARSPEGDKFYMIATDLSIATNKAGDNYNTGAVDWWGAGGSGSHSIVVWESDDLVNWSEPWLSEIAPEGAGCTWAPEFIYDEKTGEYVVYWSATKLEVDENEKVTQEYENHAIYYCKTRDFRTFTEPTLYRDGGTDASGKRVKVIDSTMIEDNGTYYRYTKNESKGTIVIDKSDAVLGKFTEVPSQTLSTDLMAAQGAVEGPIIFKMNEKSEDGKGQWCLMVDRFARGQGYYPLITTDLSSGEFRMLDQSEYSFPKDSKFRHGYVMPVTASEYSALQRKWGADDYVDKYQLEKAIADAEALNPYDYTEESWKVFEEALNTAKTALDTVKTTEEADAAAQALRDAMAKLEPKVEVALESIKVTEPDKTEYVEGEELDLTGMTVTAVYSDGREVPVDLKDVKVDGYDKDQVGTQTITVTYEGKEAAFTVTVKAKDEGGNQGGDQGGDQGGEDLNGNNPGGDNSGGNNPGGENPDGNNPAGGQDSGSADQGVVQTDAPAKTGDVAPIGIAVLLLVAAGAAIVVIVKKKRS